MNQTLLKVNAMDTVCLNLLLSISFLDVFWLVKSFYCNNGSNYTVSEVVGCSFICIYLVIIIFILCIIIIIIIISRAYYATIVYDSLT